MKTKIRLVSTVLIILAITGFSSCTKNTGDSGIGGVEFSIGIPDYGSQAKSGTPNDSSIVSYQIMISVENPEGVPVITDKLIPVYAFGTGFVSENVELNAGEFRLTKFLVINPSGVVIYATPKAGSPLAYLCTRPLPLNFNIFPDQVTKIIPEVLQVGDQTPDKFGYANFGIQIIKPLDLWTICILDNPLSMAPTQLTTAKLTIESSSGWRYVFKLQAAVNHLILRGGAELYYFILEKEGYVPQKFQFTEAELMATSNEKPLVLKIPWGSAQYRTIVLQPGPDKGKDAMISNLEPDKNFGEYKYFEATFLSEPLLTVMRSNRSLIWFNLDSVPRSAVIKKVTLTLSYDVPVPFDSSYIINAGPAAGIAWYGGVLQQIVEPWEENGVTWNKQPKTIEANQVFVPPFIRNVNFIELDVTRLFVPVAEIAAPNYGMLFKLWPVDKFPGFRFASSDFPEAKMRPRLTIFYVL